MEKETRGQKWRKELKDLSDFDLDNELQRPTNNWEEDVIKETLRRILKILKPKEDKGKLDFDEIMKEPVADTSGKL